jgi:5-methylcytosine-specific restriction endonuclease McrA
MTKEEKREKHAAYMREWTRKNRGKVREGCKRRYAEKKVAGTLPKRVLTEEEKVAARARAKAWRLANPERYAANMKAAPSHAPERNVARVKGWRKANPEKTKVLRVVGAARRRTRKEGNGGDIEAASALIREWRGRRAFVCAYCGRRFPVSKLHVDHVIPVSKGGQHDPKNLATSCGRCNIRKGAALPPYTA